MTKPVLVVALALMVMVSGPVMAGSVAGKSVNTGLVNLTIQDVPIARAIDILFQGRGLNYIIQPGVSGRVVELKLKGVTFTEALKALGDAAGFTYCVEDGIYFINSTKKTVAVQGGGPASQSVTPQPTEAPAPPPQVLSGNQVVVNNNPPSPVYYGEPQQPFYPPYGPVYPPVYTVGGTSIIGGASPIVIAGGQQYVYGRFIGPPPPSGWFSPDVERFLRFEYSVPSRPMFIGPGYY